MDSSFLAVGTHAKSGATTFGDSLTDGGSRSKSAAGIERERDAVWLEVVMLAKTSSAGQKKTVVRRIIGQPKVFSIRRRHNESGTLPLIALAVLDWHYRCYKERQMKKIEAIIHLSKLNEVQDALEGIGIDGMSVCEVKGFGRQNRHKETYRSKEYVINFLPMIRLDLVVADQLLEQAVKIIVQSAKTGSSGDGKVLISDVKEAAYALAI